LTGLVRRKNRVKDLRAEEAGAKEIRKDGLDSR